MVRPQADLECYVVRFAFELCIFFPITSQHAPPFSHVYLLALLKFPSQALLARHEALKASAEQERFEMQMRIDQLETDKQSLETENARTIQENRVLLDQLESLNSSVADSETHIKSLEATLQSSQYAVRRLDAAEGRATDLEEQISNLEAEQAALHSTLVTTEAEARSAVQRWRKAEKGLSDLQEKLERIEREAREEREHHAEVLKRMEKQRVMQKDLDTAAGRLKGAAAAKTLTDGKNGGTVVSHFVRDLLSDNANLQVGIAELRELLMNSNDEIQHLREQLLFHQPMDGSDGGNTLRVELDPDDIDPKTPRSPKSPRPEASRGVSQELHIHHHYHVARPTEPKKPPKKKRQGPAGSIFTPRPFSPAGPASPAHWRLDHRATSPALVAHSVKDSISTIPSTRWSVFSDQPSEFAPSSVPSSPISHHRRISVFDREGYDTSAPTSPTTSVDPISPVWTRKHRSQNSEASMLRFSGPRPLFLDNVLENEPHNEAPFSPGSQVNSRHKETGPGRVSDCAAEASPEPLTRSSTGSPDTLSSMPLTPSLDDSFTGNSRPRLHRAASQESIISLSGGLDIHTLQGRPSQLALRPLGAVTADIGLSAVTARPTIARAGGNGKRGSIVLRDNLLSIPSLLVTAASSDNEAVETQRSTSGGLSRLVSWRIWGNNSTTTNQPDSGTSTPTPSEEAGNPSPNVLTPTESPGSSIAEMSQSDGTEIPSKKKKPPKEMAFSPRNFGINQPGAIPGFQAYLAMHQQRGPPTKVVPEVVDAEALREGLEEDYLSN